METQERVRSRASRALGRKNGNKRNGAKPEIDIDLKKLLRALQSVRDGDFSVRLPSDQTGIGGKIADTFNEIIASNQRVARELERAGQMVGKEGKTRHRITVDRRSGAWGAMESSMNTLIDDLLWPTTEVTRTISAVAKGDLSQTDAAGGRRPAAARRIPALGHHRQHDDRADERVHVRSDARGARGRHRRQARRPGGR